jgi:hypothetical protein
VESTDEPRPSRQGSYGDIHSRWRRCDPTRRSAYSGTKDLGRPPTTPFSGFPHERERDVLVQHRIHRLPDPRISKHHEKHVESQLTVALKLIPTELVRTQSGLSTSTKAMQKNAVNRVDPASERRRPSGPSTMYAPSCIHASVNRGQDEKGRPHTKAPGHPLSAKITTSHKLPSSDVEVESPLDPVSNSFG